MMHKVEFIVVGENNPENIRAEIVDAIDGYSSLTIQELKITEVKA